MARFVVTSALEHDGKAYSAGEFVELSDRQAAAMPHAVEHAPLPAAAPATEQKKPEPAPKSTK